MSELNERAILWLDFDVILTADDE
ncbi:hypothetical protein V9T40_004180 [Parthenolecanium corni]|uniref:Uncharacterized protein n=1 Tax=Parthenolecanium corni TaxID=536013 RepID=A0AAN9TS58_9HEMI